MPADVKERQGILMDSRIIKFFNRISYGWTWTFNFKIKIIRIYGRNFNFSNETWIFLGERLEDS